MDTSGFCFKFSVVSVPRQTEMFMMNMEVYNLVPLPVAPQAGGQPVSVVWCAVYNVKGIKNV